MILCLIEALRQRDSIGSLRRYRRDGCGVLRKAGSPCSTSGKREGETTMTSPVPMVSLERARELGEATGMPARLGDHGLTGPKRRNVALGNAGASE